MSPKLFTVVLDQVFKTLDWEKAGLNTNSDFLSYLRFADDITAVANNTEEILLRIQQLSDASAKVGLKMNLDKTKVLFNKFAEPKEITVNGKKIEVNDYIYLGQLQSTMKISFAK